MLLTKSECDALIDALKLDFHKHKEWLKLANKCKESFQEYVTIPSSLPSCRITKTVCDYDTCPKNKLSSET